VPQKSALYLAVIRFKNGDVALKTEGLVGVDYCGNTKSCPNRAVKDVSALWHTLRPEGFEVFFAHPLATLKVKMAHRHVSDEDETDSRWTELRGDMIPIGDGFTDVHKPGVTNSGTEIAITPFYTRTCKRLGFSGSLLPQGAGLGDFDGQFLDPCHDPLLLGQGWHGGFNLQELFWLYPILATRTS
jgi:hypothetical protein